MNLNAAELVEPVFRFIDGMIRDWGDYLYMALVYAAIPLIAWILGGGLRRRVRPRSYEDPTPPAVGIYYSFHHPTPPPQPPPPLSGGDCGFRDEDV